MKKALFYITAAALTMNLLAPLSFAQTQMVTGAPDELPQPDLSYDGIIKGLYRLANLAFALMVVITTLFLVWAAWKYLNGDADDAKGMILNAAIALAIGLLARGLPILVSSLLGVDYQVPQ